MPKTRFDTPKRDFPRELVLGRKAAAKLTADEIAKKMNINRSTFYYKLSCSSDTWTLKDIKGFCRALDIPIDEMRQAIRM